MKKKILVVFLICCMFLGVASPAFAYGDLPDFNDKNEAYIVFPAGNNLANPSDYTDICIALVSRYPISTDPILVNVLSDGSVDSFYFPSTDDYSTLSVACYAWSPSELKWIQLFVSATNSNDSDLNGYSQFKITTPTFASNSIAISSCSSTFSMKVKGTDENFPPAPPLVNLTGELIQMTPEALDLDGKMKILAPFGISCLALLISLPLLSNLLRRFLD